MKRAALVLCGGRSKRMGRAKAWLPWFGQTMVEHVVSTLVPFVEEVVVVTAADLDLPPLSARIVRDREAELGPLAGLRDGLAVVESDLVFVTGTDVPEIPAGYLERLFSRQGACAPISEGHVQVLSAVYPARAAAEEAAGLLAAGKRRPLDLLVALGYQAIEASEVLAPGEAKPWQGFNTPEAYLSAVRARDIDAKAQIEILGRASVGLEESIFDVPVSTLGEALRRLPASLELIEDGRVAKPYLVSLGGRDVVRDLDLPIGPGERVSVLDALAGG